LAACSAIHFAARWWKPRLDQAQSLISGTADKIRSAARTSFSKWLSPRSM